MRSLVRFSLVLFSTLILVVVAYAATLPFTTVENGNTMIQTLKVSTISDDEFAYYKSCMSSDRLLVLASVNNTWDYAIMSIDEGITCKIENDTANPGYVRVVFPDTTLKIGIDVLYFKYDSVSGFFDLVSRIVHTGLDPTLYKVKYIAGGGYCSTLSYPTLSYNYIPDIEGVLHYRDDSGTRPETPENGGILSWLSDFWQTLVDTFVGLFVPADNYFSNFFEEIKNAFDAKLGGLSDLLSSITNMFNGLKNVDGDSSFVITIPDNQFYSGYDGVSVNVFEKIAPLISFLRGLFNAILVVFTIIICYKKVVTIINV